MPATIADIPEVLILHILSYLPVKERCIAGRVCKQWRRITNDNSLWRHVDLMPYKLNLKKTWKLIRSHLSECLLSIKFRGFLDKTGTRWKIKVTTVSDAVFEDLQSRCPNIRELVLCNNNIDNLDARKLPSTLTSLTLNGCSWTKGWIKNAKLPNLQYLNLDRTTRIDNAEVEDIVKFNTIESLSLAGCYRIGEKGIQVIAENLPNLVRLDISYCGCTDLSMHFVSRNMKYLKELSLSFCKDLTNEALAALGSGLRTLEVMSIVSCPKMDEGCIEAILKLKRLKKLRHSLDFGEESQQMLQLHNVAVNDELL